MRASHAVAALVVLLVSAAPALAHKLKVFAVIEDGTISGYAFFVGGGRARGSAVIIKDMGAREVFRGKTDGEGRFSWAPPAPSDFTILVDTGEGHMAEAKLAAARFTAAADGLVLAASGGRQSPSMPAAAESSTLQRHVTERQIEAAVARQIRPLLERIEALDARLRLADIVAGVAMILGLGGVGLWASARRTAKAPEP